MQPDSLIPDPSNPQAWNRYSYVGNNPINFNDPTGHRPCGEEFGCGSGGGGGGGRGGGGNNNDDDDEEEDRDFGYRGVPPEDASIISGSINAGIGPWVRGWGLDIVITHHEIGIFGVDMKGPGFTGEHYSTFGNLEDHEDTFMSPQAGAAIYGGSLWGKTLDPKYGGVKNYSGPSLNVGGSLGLGTYEYISSVDPKYGVIDRKIEGHLMGLGAGAKPAEVHVAYANARYFKNPSEVVTNFFQFLGLLEQE